MILKKYIEFIKKSVSINNGHFRVTEDMVSNGKMIKEMIPREVTGDFHCYLIDLTSLEGSPDIVGGDFNCSNNELTDLKGCPEIVHDFWCHNNNLTTLKGGPKSVSGSFDCRENLLTSLKGCPSSIGAYFDCFDNKLVSLEGLPKDFNNTVLVDNDLETEKEFIVSGGYINDYWVDLLKYMTNKHIDLTEVKGWPKDFLTPELIQSTKGISKFKL